MKDKKLFEELINQLKNVVKCAATPERASAYIWILDITEYYLSMEKPFKSLAERLKYTLRNTEESEKESACIWITYMTEDCKLVGKSLESFKSSKPLTERLKDTLKDVENGDKDGVNVLRTVIEYAESLIKPKVTFTELGNGYYNLNYKGCDKVIGSYTAGWLKTLKKKKLKKEAKKLLGLIKTTNEIKSIKVKL